MSISKTVTKVSMIILLSMGLLQAMDKKQMQENMKMMQEAYKKAGVDLSQGRPTPQQMKIVQEYMQEALFPRQKENILKEAKDVNMHRSCLEKADTLKEANACVPDDDGEEEFDVWNENEKRVTLKEIDEFIKIIPCVKKASNGKELKSCFPEQE